MGLLFQTAEGKDIFSGELFILQAEMKRVAGSFLCAIGG